METQCKWCGKTFTTLKREKYCCEPCRKEATRERARKERYEPKENGIHSMPKLCYSCYYQRNLTSSATQGKCCCYILIEGKRRGCPCDENCEKYKPKNGKRNWDFNGRGW